MDETDYVAYGRHVLVDISDATAETLNNLDELEQALVRAAIAEGVTVLGTLRHAFQPSGVTILLLLAESHVSLHTYPEEGKAFFDAFTCGVRCEPFNIFREFAEKSSLGTYKIIRCERGGFDHSVAALRRKTAA